MPGWTAMRGLTGWVRPGQLLSKQVIQPASSVAVPGSTTPASVRAACLALRGPARRTGSSYLGFRCASVLASQAGPGGRDDRSGSRAEAEPAQDAPASAGAKFFQRLTTGLFGKKT